MADSTRDQSWSNSPGGPQNSQRWVFVVRALDQPGTLTAAAAVFSNRGVSLEGALGSGIDASSPDKGRLILSFHATEAKQALLLRTLERLSCVSGVDAYHFEDERLRAIAVAKLPPDAPVPNGADNYSVETIAESDRERVIMLTGKPPVIEEAIAQFRERDQLHDVVVSYVAV